MVQCKCEGRKKWEEENDDCLIGVCRSCGGTIGHWGSLF